MTTDSRCGLRIAALWAGQIADAVATALGARPDLCPCRLLLDPNTRAPLALAGGLHRPRTPRGYRRHLGRPRHQPRCALTVGGRPVAVDVGTELRSAVVSAHAGSAAITGPLRPPATPGAVMACVGLRPAT